MILGTSLLIFFFFIRPHYSYWGWWPSIVWGLSIILTFIAAVNARPPIKEEQTSNFYTEKKIKKEKRYSRSIQELLTKINQKKIIECESAVYNYLKENKESTFTVSALGVRLENSVKTYNERKYIRENLPMILNNLITSGKIDSTLYHEELHYFVADVHHKKAEELQLVTSIPEKIEEKPMKTCPHCGQKIPLESKFCNNCGVKLEEIQPTPPLLEKEEKKPIMEVPQIKTDDVQPTSPISKVENVITEVPQIKNEEMQRTPPISKKEEEKPIIEISHIKEEKEEEPKEFSYSCRFCGMKLTEKVNICPQCGTIIKL